MVSPNGGTSLHGEEDQIGSKCSHSCYREDRALGRWPDLRLFSTVACLPISVRLQDLSLHLRRFVGHLWVQSKLAQVHRSRRMSWGSWGAS